MSKVLVLYYSSYGHIEAMASAVAEGARQTGAHVDIKRVPELVPEEIACKSRYKLDQAAPTAKVEDLVACDAIIIGAGTRFGRLSSQMANFLDQAGGLWARGACTARSAARLRRPPPSMVGRRRRCSRLLPIFFTSVWWSSASITAMPGR
jgi:NAD(P)H dehydrogenase (quinone)